MQIHELLSNESDPLYSPNDEDSSNIDDKFIKKKNKKRKNKKKSK